MWRVLIVDDDPKYRGIPRVLFERAGHLVFQAGEGEGAMRLAEGRVLDCTRAVDFDTHGERLGPLLTES